MQVLLPALTTPKGSLTTSYVVWYNISSVLLKTIGVADLEIKHHYMILESLTYVFQFESSSAKYGDPSPSRI